MILWVLLAALLLAAVAVWKLGVDATVRRLATVKEELLDWVASPRNVVTALLLLVLVDLLGGGVVTGRITDLPLGTQVFVYTLLGALPAAYWVGGKLLSLAYSSSKRYALSLDDRWSGEVDVVEAHPDVLGEYRVDGADKLNTKKIANSQQELYEIREINPAEKTLTATWHALATASEVERAKKLLWYNHKKLREKLDESREIVNSLPAIRDSARDEAALRVGEQQDKISRKDGERSNVHLLMDEIEEIDDVDADDRAVEDTVQQREDFDTSGMDGDSTEGGDA